MTDKKKSTQEGPGRPFLPKKERRSVLMQFRTTEAEAKIIKKAAAHTDMSVSDWIRNAALNYGERQ